MHLISIIFFVMMVYNLFFLEKILNEARQMVSFLRRTRVMIGLLYSQKIASMR